MSRARRPTPAPAALSARPKGAFEELAPLRGKLGPGPAQRPTPDKRRLPPADDDDSALFRSAVSDVAPVTKAQGHIELARPKPAPTPRQRTPEVPEPEPERAARGRAAPLEGEALFRAEMEDVTPLGASGRADPGRPLPRGRRILAHEAARSAGSAEAPPVILPPDADLAAPEDLFRLAVRGAQPIDRRNRAELARPAPPPEPLKRCADEQDALRESLSAPLTFEDRLDMGDEAAFLRPGLPRRVLTDLRRGRWVLQAQLDLHGLNREEARGELATFLSASLQRGDRCVRVIHGKGHGSPGKVSILKQLSRGWLAQREEILAFCQAGPHSGGSGALLVLLKGRTAVRDGGAAAGGGD